MPSPVPQERQDATRRSWLDAGVLLALAAGIRLLHVLALRGSTGFDADLPPWDSYYYAEAAWALAQGHWSAEALSYVSSPLYLALLWGCFEVFGRNVLVPRLLQCVAGGLTAAFTYALGRRIFDRRTGWVAGAMVAGYGAAIFYDGELLKSSWGLTCAAAFLALLLRPGLGSRLAAGASFGGLLLVRGNLVALLPLALVWLWRAREGRGRALASFALGMGVVLGAAQLFQQAAPEPEHFLARGAGLHVFLGNHPAADGTYHALPGVRPTAAGHVIDGIAQASQAAGRPLTPTEASRYWLGRAWQWMTDDPAAFARLTLRKARLFTNAYEIPSNEDATTARRYSWVLRLPWLGFGVLAPLAVAGIWRGRSRAGARLLAGYLALVFLSLVPLFVTSRYRLPVLPALAVLAAAGAVGLWDLLRQRAHRRAGALALAVAGSAWIVNAPTPLSVETFETHAAGQLAQALGTGPSRSGNAARAAGVAKRLLEDGDRAGAALVVARALDAAPRDPALLALERELAGAQRVSILLVVIDTLRADHLPCYGYARDTAPVFCGLARHGALFENAFTPRPATTPALASLFTGLDPHRHGVESLYQVLPALHETLAERFARRGYRTGAFVSSFVMGASFSGLDQGFEVYDDALTRPEPFRENFERGASETVARALAWLGTAVAQEPFFLFVHLIEPHGPYTPPAPYDTAFPCPGTGPRVPHVPAYQKIPGVERLDDFTALYDGEIRAADAALGELLEGLEELGLARTTHVVVTGDHGESFGEEDQWLVHGTSTHAAQTRVPLIVRPAVASSPRRFTASFSLTELFAKLLELAGDPSGRRGLRPPAGDAVVTSVPLRGRPDAWDVRIVSSACTARVRLERRTARSFDSGVSSDCQRRLIEDATPRLEDLRDYTRPFPVLHRTEAFRPGFRRRFLEDRGDEIAPLSDAERSRLRSLGYAE